MNLEEFVSEALVQVFRAVEKAQKEIQKIHGTGRINPREIRNQQNMSTHLGEDKLIRDVEFDVAVTRAGSRAGSDL